MLLKSHHTSNNVPTCFPPKILIKMSSSFPFATIVYVVEAAIFAALSLDVIPPVPNVDFFLLNKSVGKYYNDSVVRYGYCRGEEAYKYVNRVTSNYNHYLNVIEE